VTLPVSVPSGYATSANQTTILSAVNGITTNTARSAPRIPDFMARPAAGSVAYTGDLYLYTLQGQLEDADANTVTVHARNAAGGSLDGGLASTTMTRVSVGFYRLTYTVASTDAAQAVYFDFSWTVAAAPMKDGAASEVQDAENYAFLTAIKAKTDQMTFTVANRIDCNAARYAMGAIWLDTVSGTAGTVPGVNGTAELPANTLANALAIAAAIPGMRRFHVGSGTSLTLTATFGGQIIGDNYALALGGQDISGAIFQFFGPVSGTASVSGAPPVFDTGPIGNVTLPGCVMVNAGFTGLFTAAAAGGAFDFYNCHAQVPGSSVPTFDFSAVSVTATIQCRNYYGGATWLFNANCTSVIECPEGGVHTITTGGGNVEFRGDVKAVALTTSGTSTTNIHGVVGQISIAGTGGTVNIYGLHGTVTNTSTGTTVNDLGQVVTRLDVPVSSRGTYAGGPVASVTAPVTVAAFSAGAITDAAFAVPADATGPATGILARINYLYRRFFGKVVNDKVANTIKTYQADGNTVRTTQVVSSNPAADEVDAAT
jgi:hypothetical protein